MDSQTKTKNKSEIKQKETVEFQKETTSTDDDKKNVKYRS